MAKNSRRMDLTIIIPTYNERDNLEKTIAKLTPVLRKAKVDYEIVIVDDNSPDGTGAFAKQLHAQDRRIKPFIRVNARGFGLSLRDGITHAKGKFIIPTSADLADAPDDIVRLYRTIKKGYDVVYTTRFAKGGKIINYPGTKLFCNRAFNYLTTFLFLMPYHDISNGFKAYRKSILDALVIESAGFEINPELSIKSYLRGKTFAEIGVSWTGRTSGLSKLNLIKVGPRYVAMVLNLYWKRLIHNK
ncbi:MAG TPA: glycosyltransferase [Candidatus Nanoarchaeia archaeon]|nr:glycosyltransferase [Candidatus Nanoarchaeia archaeon]